MAQEQTTTNKQSRNNGRDDGLEEVRDPISGKLIALRNPARQLLTHQIANDQYRRELRRQQLARLGL